ncbi:MAG: substrate-binding domain-containing protein [Acidimicrobiales bacterium]
MGLSASSQPAAPSEPVSLGHPAHGPAQGPPRTLGTAPRIEDVARRAGVSTATVSYVLNDRGRVSGPTRERVRSVVEELGYVPSARGRSLALGQAQTVGLLATHERSTEEGFAALVASLSLALLDRGYHLLLLAGEAPGGARSLRGVASSGRVDGAVLVGLEAGRSGEATLSWARLARLPVVVLGHAPPGVASVEVDQHAAARLATEHLRGLGHRRVGLLGHASAALDAWEAGCREAMAPEAGSVVTALGPQSSLGGHEAARSLLMGAGRPTGIVAMDDIMAEGALRAAASLGIGVPEQLSVVGYGNTRHGSQAFPPLTTISPDWESLGTAIGQAMLGALAGAEHQQVLCSPTLVVRSSTAPAGSFATPETAIEEPVLKAGPTYAVWSNRAAIGPETGRHGVYLGDTRMISVYQARVDGRPLVPDTLTTDATRISATYVFKTAAATRRLRRSVELYPDRLEDRWEWEQWGSPAPFTLEVSVAADFQDVFETRGLSPLTQGETSVTTEASRVTLRYAGRDGINRRVTVAADLAPDGAPEPSWCWTLPAEPAGGTLLLTTSWLNPVMRATMAPQLSWPRIETARPGWTAALRRATEDLDMLATVYGAGALPMAGLPWFGTLFGRDAILTSLETMAFSPDLALGAITSLTELQGVEDRPETEEEPGKIVHEVRLGEMARLGEVPFGRYYGSVDATPLFITLTGATWRRTGDTAWLATMMPAVERALAWVRKQRNDRGLYEFLPRHPGGLLVQSWKDSSDSMVFRDGSHGAPPLAVAEVQGYVYQAFTGLGRCYSALGDEAAAARCESDALSVRQAFHEAFWLPERDYYALAVDGRGRQLDSLSSDPGQCLWAQIVPEPYRQATAATLTSPALFSDWGIRTLGSDEAAYDPYSYHRGSVWPHDTALAAAGLAACGQREKAADVAAALLDAAASFPRQRLPELFSGDARRLGGPFPYPGACSPQAWAAGSALLALATLAGLEIDTVARVARLSPLDGRSLGPLRIEGLPVGGASVAVTWDGQSAKWDGLPEGWRVGEMDS